MTRDYPASLDGLAQKPAVIDIGGMVIDIRAEQ
jgi:hypothetical protein